MEHKRCMLSTIDNPFNPFEDFDSWFQYDIEKGYYSCGFLARIACTSDSLTEIENEIEIERAIDEIVFEDFTGMYIKVVENDNKKSL